MHPTEGFPRAEVCKMDASAFLLTKAFEELSFNSLFCCVQKAARRDTNTGPDYHSKSSCALVRIRWPQKSFSSVFQAAPAIHPAEISSQQKHRALSRPAPTVFASTAQVFLPNRSPSLILTNPALFFSGKFSVRAAEQSKVVRRSVLLQATLPSSWKERDLEREASSPRVRSSFRERFVCNHNDYWPLYFRHNKPHLDSTKHKMCEAVSTTGGSCELGDERMCQSFALPVFLQ